ncbi:MAG: PAS domain S-box protein [Verrucomicrobia bacterium]|nr:PAS domain S-box protein [Verrucomicrobiota bacterium]
MTNPLQGERIVRLVRVLVAVGLAIVVTTTGLVGWTLARVRSERAQAIAELDKLDEASQALHERAVQSRIEIQTMLDESAAGTSPQSAVADLEQLIRRQLDSRPDPAMVPSLQQLSALALRLAEFSGRTVAWRAGYSFVWEDLRQQRTMGKVRDLVTRLRSAVEAFEGRQRLNEAIKYRRWRRATGEEAARQAGEMLLEQAWRQSRDSADFKNQLAEFTRLVELLGGEEQFDNLTDLKDNKLKPVLDRLSRSIAAFGAQQPGEESLKPQTIEDFKVALFGEGYVSDDAHQNVQVGHGGLFTLRRDALSFRRERETLKNELAAVFQSIESANASFAQSTQARTTALAEEMERSLAAGCRQMVVFGGACSVLFLWLAWMISRGINAQVNALEQARAEAEQGRSAMRQLMLEQQANTSKLAVAHKELKASEYQMRMILESEPECVKLVAADGRLLEMNPAGLKMVEAGSREEAVGKSVFSIIAPEYAAMFRSLHEAVLRGESRTAEFEIIGLKGTRRWMETHACPMRDVEGKIFAQLAVTLDITARKNAEEKLTKAQKQLVETSRMAGMAEVATGVLHNVGNVLNSVNISSMLISEKLKKSKAALLDKVAGMLREHASDLGTFLTTDAKGKQLPAFLDTLAEGVSAERAELLKEMTGLQRNINHIKDIVSMQQGYAKVSAATETVKLDELLEDTLRMNATSFTRHDVRVIRDFGETPPIDVDKHKLLQILVNLVRNAKQACHESGREDKEVTLRIVREGERVRISVSDNGVGILPENLDRVFNHGFTTKKEGHGFGLHSGANAAREMGGSLAVRSDGPGRGATFTLDLPLQPYERGRAPVSSPGQLAA